MNCPPPFRPRSARCFRSRFRTDTQPGGDARSILISLFLLVVLPALASPSTALSEDWTGWMGNQRDGVYREAGLIDRIPADGLRVLWRTPIQGGYAGPAVKQDRVIVFDFEKESGDAFNNPSQRASVMGKERVIALSTKTGRELWRHEYHCPYNVSYPAGPRCTPTIDGDRVYTLGSEGHLRCLSLAEGDLIWSRHLPDDFGAEVPVWGFAAHPLVRGDLLYTMVGGSGQGIVAFDKMSGEVRWKTLDVSAGYCPPCVIRQAGVDQLIAYHPQGVHALEPETGTALWNVSLTPEFDMSISRPMRDGNRLYASGIRTESVMIQLDPERPAAEPLWRGERDESIYASNSTPLFVDGVVYGTDCNEGSLMAVDADNGKRLWSTFRATRPEERRFVKHGTAFLTRINDTNRYFIFSEIGDLILAELTAKEYRELGRFHVLEPTEEAFGRSVVWSHPAYANRVGYFRNDQEIVAVSLAGRDPIR